MGELQKLRRELAAEQKRTRALSKSVTREREALAGALGPLTEDLDKLLSDGFTIGLDLDTVARSGALADSVGEAEHSLQESRAWADKQHGKYMDFATELATLREMSIRELRARKDSSRQKLVDIRDATHSMSELRATAKLLRERVSKLVKTAVADRTAERVEDDA